MIDRIWINAGCSHKYWYDILMGFKTEILVAYIATLIFIVAALLIKTSARQSADNHIIEKMETENERLEIEEKVRSQAGGAE